MRRPFWSSTSMLAAAPRTQPRARRSRWRPRLARRWPPLARARTRSGGSPRPGYSSRSRDSGPGRSRGIRAGAELDPRDPGPGAARCGASRGLRLGTRGRGPPSGPVRGAGGRRRSRSRRRIARTDEEPPATRAPGRPAGAGRPTRARGRRRPRRRERRSVPIRPGVSVAAPRSRRPPVSSTPRVSRVAASWPRRAVARSRTRVSRRSPAVGIWRRTTFAT